jgi:hypothetical protein
VASEGTLPPPPSESDTALVMPKRCATRCSALDHELHVVAPVEDGVEGEKLRIMMRLGAEELSPDRPNAPRGGNHAVGSKDLATLPFETLTPSFFSSPTSRR